ncbi:hypothetical protein G7Z99_08410 [Pseudomonas entomophila]|uniref:hypothetical protein n=1 Tax=Pseudomonas entomophila TaxID=312306 RepID=UPI0015E3BE95|nr:hypothetical protein [Pseudomonas entomophila]MBA1189069.1 hypothetical protein [Pseudomonas entomophila]
MLKIVPDPPAPSLEDLLIHAAEHLTCAQFLTRKITRLHPDSADHDQLLAAATELQTIYERLEQMLGHTQTCH